MKLGVCDWGIGGLGFYRLLREARPDLDIVYLGDQGVPGYGKLPRAVLADRLHSVFEQFRLRGVEEVVVACNAASTVLDLVSVEGVRATGVIRGTLDTLGSGPGRIGVIGGRRTIISGAYARPLRTAGWTVTNRIAQPLSGLIEDGKAESAETEAALNTILRPLQNVDRLVLACTHYIVLEEAIRRRLPNVELVDPASVVWTRMAPSLPPRLDRQGQTTFLTTGDPGLMNQTALAAFGVRMEAEYVDLVPRGSI